MEWPERWYAWRAGDGCPSCAEGRPDELPIGVRYFAGDAADAYLVRADIQRGLSIVVWRGRVGSSRVDLQACKLEYSIVSPK